MRFLLILISFLFAYEAKIVNVNGNIAKIDKIIKRGISGFVICPYMKEEIICARAVAFNDKIELKPYEELKNSAFALPFVLPKRGDRVIFAKNYNRVVIIAPNQDIYLKVKDIYKNSSVISSDILAVNLEKKVTINALKQFAKEWNIGRYVFVLDKLYEVDAYSFYVINSKTYKTAKYKKAFFTYFKKFDIKPFKWKIVNGKLIIKD